MLKTQSHGIVTTQSDDSCNSQLRLHMKAKGTKTWGEGGIKGATERFGDPAFLDSFVD